MKHIKTILLFFILFLVVCCLLFAWGIYFPKYNLTTEEKSFVIEKGQGLFDISKNLEKKNLIKNRIFFNVYGILTRNIKSLQAGEYELNPSMSIPEIAQKIISGQVIKNTITIPEGWNLRDIGWYFESKGMFMAEEVFELAGFPTIDYNKVVDLPEPRDFSNNYDFLKDKPKNIGLEGYLFPDTYQLNKGDELESIIRKMLDNFDKKMTQDLREKITNHGKTIFEIITMASLIEKEVRTKQDKEIVSGILWKRLENSMGLQVDATISYITGKKTTKIFKEETQIDSFYNTYKYPGLPLGPICNPGIKSILAALYAKDSNYWYYLSVPETGETIFSKTLEEHNIAKEKYLSNATIN